MTASLFEPSDRTEGEPSHGTEVEPSDRTEGLDGTDRSVRARGPGELTLTAVVLFALGAYGIAAGGVTGEERAVAVGIFAFTVFAVGVIWPIVALAGLHVSVVAPTDATVGDAIRLRIRLRGRGGRVEVRVLDPTGQLVASIDPDRHGHRTPSDPARRVRPCTCAGPHVRAARRLPADTSGAGRATGSDPGRAQAAPVAGIGAPGPDPRRNQVVHGDRRFARRHRQVRAPVRRR